MYYLLFTAGLVPLLVTALVEGLEPPENSLVMSSETSGSSGLGFSMFMDCSISCKDSREMNTDVDDELKAGDRLREAALITNNPPPQNHEMIC